jgi:hypothetical protein
LITSSDIYLWFGKGASENEKRVAKELVENRLLAKDEDLQIHDVILEEDTTSEMALQFWDSIAPGHTYECPSYTTERPHLYLCSNASGIFRVEELFDFCQDDLSPDDIMVLDCFSLLFVSFNYT